MQTSKTLIIILVSMIFSTNCFSNVSLPAIFSDGMVLQRNADVKIWGWAKPGEVVTIKPSWESDSLSTKVKKNGYWKLQLQTPDLREPQELVIKGYNTIRLENVLLGEVWLVSGQSNMEWSAAAGIEGGEAAIAAAKNPNIRFFTVANRTSEFPQQDLDGQWTESTPETMKYFSAVAYFFGKRLQEELDVPVGLINSTWGGTPAEAWTPSEVIENDPVLKKANDRLPNEQYGPQKAGLIYNSMIAPLVPYELAGVIWYQGESNTANADTYKELFSAMINSWREKWGKQLPFLFAQIAPFDYGDNFSGVKIRDAQRRTLELPKTGMVMTSDIGNIHNIHPKNKIDVGRRFANLALAEVYGKNIPAQAPLLASAQKSANKVIIKLDNSEGLHLNKKDRKSQFELDREDGKFYPAKMKLQKGQIQLSSKKVRDPKAVRFSWGNTSTSNIFNAAGLPLSSFSEELDRRSSGNFQENSLIATGAQLELIADGFEFTEGPAVDAVGNVYFTDQPNNNILKWSVSDGKVAVFMDDAGRANGLFFGPEGDLYACADKNSEIWKISAGKKVKVIASNFDEMKFNGPNDLWIDSRGGIYFTDPYYKRPYRTYTEQPITQQRVYYLTRNRQQLKIATEDLVKPNGIIGTPDGKTLFIADIEDNKTWKYEISEDGSLKNRTLFTNLGSDGITLDERGNVYLTGDGVTVFNPKGEKILHIPIDKEWTANVTFGGKDHDRLFITAMDSLFSLQMKVKGAE